MPAEPVRDDHPSGTALAVGIDSPQRPRYTAALNVVTSSQALANGVVGQMRMAGSREVFWTADE
jgi:hypothetical protein